MPPKLTLSILVPVFNEQYLVQASLQRLEVLAESEYLERVRVIVVNDASTDQTSAVLRGFRERFGEPGQTRLEWLFQEHDKNQGKGAAIRHRAAVCGHGPGGDSRRRPGISPGRLVEDGSAVCH